MQNPYKDANIFQDDVHLVGMDGQEPMLMASSEREECAQALGGTFRTDFYRDRNGDEYFYDNASGLSEDEWLEEQRSSGIELTRAGINERPSNYIYTHKRYDLGDGGDLVSVREDEEEAFRAEAQKRGWSPTEVFAKRWNGVDVSGKAEALANLQTRFSEDGQFSDDVMMAFGASEADVVNGKLYMQGRVEKIDESIRKQGELGFAEYEAKMRGVSTIGREADGVGDWIHMYATEAADAATIDTYWTLGEMAEQLGGDDGLEKIRNLGFWGRTRAALWGGLSIEEAATMSDEDLHNYLKEIKSDQELMKRITELRGLTFGAKVGSGAIDMGKLAVEMGATTALAAAMLASVRVVPTPLAVGVLGGAISAAGGFADEYGRQTADRMYFNPVTGRLEKVADGRSGGEAAAYTLATRLTDYTIELVGGKLVGKLANVAMRPVRRVAQNVLGKEMATVLGLTPGVVTNWAGGGVLKQTAMKMSRAYHQLAHNSWGRVVQSGIAGITPSGVLEELSEELIQAGISEGFNLRGDLDLEKGKIAEASWRAAGAGMLEVLKSAPEFATTLALYNVGAGPLMRGMNHAVNAYGNHATLKQALRWRGFTPEQIRNMSREEIKKEFRAAYMEGDDRTAEYVTQSMLEQHETAGGMLAELEARGGTETFNIAQDDAGVFTVSGKDQNGAEFTVTGNEQVRQWAAGRLGDVARELGFGAFISNRQLRRVGQAAMFISKEERDNVTRMLRETGVNRAFEVFGNTPEEVDAMQQAIAFEYLANSKMYVNTPMHHLLLGQSRAIVREMGDKGAGAEFMRYLNGARLESATPDNTKTTPVFTTEDLSAPGEVQQDGTVAYKKDGIVLRRHQGGTYDVCMDAPYCKTPAKGFKDESSALSYANALAAKRRTREAEHQRLRVQAEQIYDTMFGNKGEQRNMLVLHNAYENAELLESIRKVYDESGASGTFDDFLRSSPALYHAPTGGIIIFTDNITSLTGLVSALRHEGTHAGMNATYRLSNGANSKGAKRFVQRASRIFKDAGGYFVLRDALGSEITEEEFAQMDPASQALALDEAMAYLCELMTISPSMTERITDTLAPLMGGGALSADRLTKAQRTAEARAMVAEAFSRVHDPRRAAALAEWHRTVGPAADAGILPPPVIILDPEVPLAKKAEAEAKEKADAENHAEQVVEKAVSKERERLSGERLDAEVKTEEDSTPEDTADAEAPETTEQSGKPKKKTKKSKASKKSRGVKVISEKRTRSKKRSKKRKPVPVEPIIPEGGDPADPLSTTERPPAKTSAERLKEIADSATEGGEYEAHVWELLDRYERGEVPVDIVAAALAEEARDALDAFLKLYPDGTIPENPDATTKALARRIVFADRMLRQLSPDYRADVESDSMWNDHLVEREKDEADAQEEKQRQLKELSTQNKPTTVAAEEGGQKDAPVAPDAVKAEVDAAWGEKETREKKEREEVERVTKKTIEDFETDLDTLDKYLANTRNRLDRTAKKIKADAAYDLSQAHEKRRVLVTEFASRWQAALADTKNRSKARPPSRLGRLSEAETFELLANWHVIKAVGNGFGFVGKARFDELLKKSGILEGAAHEDASFVSFIGAIIDLAEKWHDYGVFKTETQSSENSKNSNNEGQAPDVGPIAGNAENAEPLLQDTSAGEKKSSLSTTSKKLAKRWGLSPEALEGIAEGAISSLREIFSGSPYISTERMKADRMVKAIDAYRSNGTAFFKFMNVDFGKLSDAKLGRISELLLKKSRTGKMSRGVKDGDARAAADESAAILEKFSILMSLFGGTEADIEFDPQNKVHSISAAAIRVFIEEARKKESDSMFTPDAKAAWKNFWKIVPQSYRKIADITDNESVKEFRGYLKKKAFDRSRAQKIITIPILNESISVFANSAMALDARIDEITNVLSEADNTMRKIAQETKFSKNDSYIDSKGVGVGTVNEAVISNSIRLQNIGKIGATPQELKLLEEAEKMAGAVGIMNYVDQLQHPVSKAPEGESISERRARVRKAGQRFLTLNARIFNKTGWFMLEDGMWRRESKDVENIFDPKTGALADILAPYFATFEADRLLSESEKAAEAGDYEKASRLLDESIDIRAQEQQNLPPLMMDFVLEDLLPEDSDLFSRYPILRTLPVRFRPRGYRGLPGSAFANHTGITFLGANPPSEMYISFVHEMQHVIQRIEKFLTGGSSENFGAYDTIAQIYDALYDNPNPEFARSASPDVLDLAEQAYRPLSKVTGDTRVDESGSIEPVLRDKIAAHSAYTSLLGEAEAYAVSNRAGARSEGKSVSRYPWEGRSAPSVVKNGARTRLRPENIITTAGVLAMGEIESARDVLDALGYGDVDFSDFDTPGSYMEAIPSDIRLQVYGDRRRSSAKLRALDARYFDALEKGDKLTMRLVLEKIAEANQYDTVPLYHGVSRGKREAGRGHTTFRGHTAEEHIFTAEDMKAAKTYAADGMGRVKNISDFVDPMTMTVDEKLEYIRNNTDYVPGTTDLHHVKKEIVNGKPVYYYRRATRRGLVVAVARPGDEVFELDLIRAVTARVYQLYGRRTKNMVELDAEGDLYTSVPVPARTFGRRDPNGEPLGVDNAWHRDHVLATDFIADQAFAEGFDGVIVENVVDDAAGDGSQYGEPFTENIYFHSHNIKSADLITYDDDGNIIPPSQRFNPKAEDIRFKISKLYTGSAADYDKPSLHYIGTGEGTQVYGWGLYASNRRGIAEHYAEQAVAKGAKFFINGVPLPYSTSGTALYGDEELHFELPDGLTPSEQYALDQLSQYGGDIELAAKGVLHEVQRASNELKEIDAKIAASPDGENTKVESEDIFGEETTRTLGEERKWILKNLDSERKVYDVFERGAITKENAVPHIYEQSFFTDRPKGDESHLLSWYEPLSEEHKRIFFDALNELGFTRKKLPNTKAGWGYYDKDGRRFIFDPDGDWVPTGEEMYDILSRPRALGSPKATSEYLAKAGIDGVKYPAKSYRSTVKDGDKVGWNYVSFRDDNISVDHQWVDNVLRFKMTKAVRSNVTNLLSKRRPDLSEEQRNEIIDTIEHLGEVFQNANADRTADDGKGPLAGYPKYEQAAAKWFINTSVSLPEDGWRIAEALRIANKHKADPMNFSGPAEIFDTFGEQPREQKINPDTVYEFKNKKVSKNGKFVVYELDDTRDAQAAVRRIVDNQWGKQSQPWCLITRADINGKLSIEYIDTDESPAEIDYSEKGLERAWDYWEVYNGHKKRIGFYEGKLVGFDASRYDGVKWWNREDQSAEHPTVISASKLVKEPGVVSSRYIDEETGELFGEERNIHRGSMRHGKYEAWHPNGTKIVEAYYKDGKRHGKYVERYSDGSEVTESYYKDGEKHGWLSVFRNDRIHKKELYHNGELTIEESFDHEGNPREGRHTVRDGRGRLELHGYYKKGRLVGDVFKFEYYRHSNGPIASTKTTYDNGKAVREETIRFGGGAKVVDFDENGVPKSMANINKNGQLYGVLLYNVDEVPKLSLHVSDDGEIVKANFYDEDGDNICEAEVRNGVFHGVYTEWRRDGTSVMANFQDGNLVFAKHYNSNHDRIPAPKEWKPMFPVDKLHSFAVPSVNIDLEKAYKEIEDILALDSEEDRAISDTGRGDVRFQFINSADERLYARLYQDRVTQSSGTIRDIGNGVYDKIINASGPLFRAVRRAAGTANLDDRYNVEAAAKNVHGKIRVKAENLHKKYLMPLLALMKKHGLDPNKLDDYLYATFAPERNKMIQARTLVVDPNTGEMISMDESGSGMSLEESRAILAKLKEDPKRAAYNEAMNLVWKMNGEVAAMAVGYGIATQQQVDTWSRLSPHYVPLKDLDSDHFHFRRGAKHLGGLIHRAKGRETRAASPLAASVWQANELIKKGELANVNRTLATFIEKYDPNGTKMGGRVMDFSGTVKVLTKGAPMFVPNGSEAEKSIQEYNSREAVIEGRQQIVLIETPESAELGGKLVASDSVPETLRVKIVQSKQAAPNVVEYFENGVRRYIVFDKTRNDAVRVAVSANRANIITPHEGDALYAPWRLVQRLTRWKADVSTSLNPKFILRNLGADIFNVGMTLMTEGKYRELGSFAKHYISAIKTVRALAKGRDVSKTDIGKYYLEAREQGMLTGVFGEGAFKDAAHKMTRDIKRMQGGSLLKGWESFKDFMETIGSYPEQGARLAVYAAMRESGMSPAQAAQYGREITVDFNAKGELTPLINTLYMFSNAAAQGIARAIKAVHTGAEARGGGVQGYVRAALPGVLVATAMGYISSVLMDAAGDDDDEDEVNKSKYAKLPEHVKKSNVTLPFLGDTYVQLPTRGMWQPFTHLGTLIYDFQKGTRTAEEVVSGFTVSLRDSVDFIGGNSPTLAQWVAPTIFDPMIQVIEGKDWAGRDVYRRDYGQAQANAWRGKTSTGNLYQMIAKGLNSVTGGNEIDSGLIDLYPETYKLFAEFFSGSLAQIALNDIPNTVESLVGARDLSASDIPVVGGVIRTDGTTESMYYKAYDLYETVSKEVRGYRKMRKEAKTPEDRMKWTQRIKEVEKRYPWARSVDALGKIVNSINTMRKQSNTRNVDESVFKPRVDELQTRFIRWVLN